MIPLSLLTFQVLIEDCEKILNDIDGVSPVHGRFYELTSNYHKLMGNHAQYYQEALRFLGCTDLKVTVLDFQIEVKIGMHSVERI